MADEEKPDVKEACSGLKEQLISCMKESECMQKDGKSVRECMQSTSAGVNEDCRQIQYSFYECRRSMLDMRNRFRGRKGY
ncbi:cytochrome c oxidase assembly factor 5-like [Clytia hemisphaerica]|uniref:cytochrome c oxidase assembly factor 5-like n=1 Tax=Clytia hemisphaerica TaxID=252671 RepID=UPI0034D5A76C